MELVPFGKYSTLVQKILILSVLAVIALGLIPLYHPFNWSTADLVISLSEVSSTHYAKDHEIRVKEQDSTCDIFKGEWVWNPDAPYYTNMTCLAFDEFNCMKFGRPDSDYLKWKWKPNGCELPIFNPFQFLDMVRNKSLAFVGDSLGRNQMESLICLLARVEYPLNISDNPDEYSKKYKYATYNFTLATYWSPFLVSTTEPDVGPNHTTFYNLYLDEADKKWTDEIERYDYVILNAGHWFHRASFYYKNKQRVGCRGCGLQNVIEFPLTSVYQSAWSTALTAINNLENFKGVTILRTFSPFHFEGRQWFDGGYCARTRPYRSNEIVLEGQNLDKYKIQFEEFKAAEEEGKMRGKKFRLMDITQAMLLRPDGHPSKYVRPWLKVGHVVSFNDCLHWCLRGPIDSWAEFLFHMLKMESDKSFEEKLQ